MKFIKLVFSALLFTTLSINAATFYVSASATGANNGTSWENAYTNIQNALTLSAAGSVLSVTNGTYYGTISSANKAITIQSVNGPLHTIINGNGTATTLTLGTTSANKSTVITGFTIVGSITTAIKYGTLNRCIVKDNYTSSYLILNTTLNDCLIIDNSCGSYVCNTTILYNCTVTRNASRLNSSTATGGTYNGTIYNSIVFGNTAIYSVAINNYYGGTYAYSCTYPAKTGTGNISTTPLFVDSINEDVRQRTGSPTLNTGLNTYARGTLDLHGNVRTQATTIDMGCLEGNIDGFVISGSVVGSGILNNKTSVVLTGNNATFNAVVTDRTFSNFLTNGVFATSNTNFVWSNVTADGTITAIFNNMDGYVDASRPNDLGDGLSWATAKKSIQSAINGSYAGETVWVTNGTYEPISSGNKAITIKSMNGYKHTIIDGGHTNQCAVLGTTLERNTVLFGFMLRNGYSMNYNVCGGTIYNSYITSCNGRTEAVGGVTLYNCVIAGNYGTYGGGAYLSILNNCTVINNTSLGGITTSGTGSSTIKNCIVWNNRYLNGVLGNYTTSPTGKEYNCGYPLKGVGSISDDPLLVSDFGDGRFRSELSPCIDAGNNSYAVGDYDIDGNPRIQNGTVDMGAYEGAVTNGIVIVPSISGVGYLEDSSPKLVQSGDTLEFNAIVIDRTFDRFLTNGVFATSNTNFVWSNITVDGTITAVFKPETIHVSALRTDDSGNGFSWATAKKTISEAILNSKPGDTILVNDGVYSDAAIFTDEDQIVTLKSVNGAYNTIIKPNLGQGIDFSNFLTASRDSVIDGFTICDFNGFGAAITKATIKNSIIRNNVCETESALSRCVIDNCLIISNSTLSTARSGGAYISIANNSVFMYNSALDGVGGGMGGIGSIATNCLFAYNLAKTYGGAQALLSNCTVTENSASVSYGGGGKNTDMWNSIVKGNYAPDQPDCPLMDFIHNSCITLPDGESIESDWYISSITNNPKFVNSAIGDFRLKPNSPCVDTGSNQYNTQSTDLNGEPRVKDGNIDMGCFEFFYDKLPSEMNPMGDKPRVYNRWYKVTDQGVEWHPAYGEESHGEGYYSVFDDVIVFRAATSQIIENPAKEIDGTWRRTVLTNVISKFVAAKVEATSRYQYHRDTPFGETGSLWTHPNCFQLYETNGVNTDAHDPRSVNQTFFWPELADALLCQSSWRGDWYAHRPYIVIAPHYAVSAAHWNQNNSNVPFCTNRLTQAFMTNQLVTNYAFSGMVGTVVDISVHKFRDAFPSNLIVNVVRQSVLTNQSPSMLSKSIGILLSSHNTVHPVSLTACNSNKEEPNSLERHQEWDWVGVSWMEDDWMEGNYYDLGKMSHSTHMYDSGHGYFFWIKGKLVLVGSFSIPEGGSNSFMKDSTIDDINSIMSLSGSDERMQELTIDDL
jgi:hypothetical protein